jgi:hypothetical protein
LKGYLNIEKGNIHQGILSGSKPGYQQKELVFTAIDKRDKNGSADLVW